MATEPLSRSFEAMRRLDISLGTNILGGVELGVSEGLHFADDFFSTLYIDARRICFDEEEEEEITNEVCTELDPIEVDAVNFYCKEQASKHHTDAFDLVQGKNPVPVLRRGETFVFAIRFKRPYKAGEDKLQLQLVFGQSNSSSHGTLVNLEVTNDTEFYGGESRWGVSKIRETEDEVVLRVQVPALAEVGIWRLKVVSSVLLHSPDYSGNSPSRVHQCPENIYILFNPWCKDDPVHMDNEEWLQEYVLRTSGKLYGGTYNSPYGRPWDFGQFNVVVLPACMFILHKSKLPFKSRGDPIKVVRSLSALINANDDGGVVWGKWSEPYSDGTSPTKWTGSIEILKQYLQNGGKPVKYGQCWVFSGVFTTVCRALGIPCRSVTNYISAHDSDDSVTIDKIFDITGSLLSEEQIWNFHVWNDCWMTRPDLPSGYGGWQAVDSTPQERSAGMFRTGPASVLAIKRGEINHMYDCPFIFSEVNADIISWIQGFPSANERKVSNINTNDVGRLIVTKRIGYVDNSEIDDLQDITNEYKSSEGLDEERITVLNAARRRRRDLENIYEMPTAHEEDVEFELLDIDKVMIGKPINMIVKVQNWSSEKRTVTAVLCCSSVYYTGVHAKEVKKETGTFILQPHQREQLIIDLEFDDYYDKLVEFSMMKIHALATVHETNQTWSSEDDFRVEKPRLLLKVNGDIKRNKPFDLIVSFTNPLVRPLQECVLCVDGEGINRREIKLSDVRPGAEVFHKERVIPRRSGKEQIIAVFNSVQLLDVFGSKILLVED